MALVASACGGGSPATVATTATTVAATTATTTTTLATTGTWFDGIAASTCFDDVFTDTGEFDFSLPAPIVPCEGEHDNEVVALVTLGQNDYPDDPSGRADTACALAYADFLGRPIGETLLIPFNVYPTAEDWDAGVRHAVCAVYSGDPMIGTARSGDLTVPGAALALLVISEDHQQLWIIDSGTGEVVADLTTPDAPEPRGAPAWTPDASALAVTAIQPGEDADIFLVDPTTGESVVLIASDGNDENPTIAPFGTVLAYSSDQGGTEFEIYVDDLDAGTSQQLIIDLERRVSPDWSPDGERIVFRGRAVDNSDIYVIDVASGEITRLTDDPEFDGDPRWSPDGSRIVFSSTRSGSYDLWVMDADGSNPTRLTDHPADEEYPTWSPDGRFIAYHTDRLGFPQVWVMRADGSDQSLLVGEHPSAYAAFGPAGALDALG